MGSAIGGVSSIVQYRKSKKQLAKMEAQQAAAEEEAKRLTPAEAQAVEGGADSEAAMKKKRKGVQATFTAKQSPSGVGTVGE